MRFREKKVSTSFSTRASYRSCPLPFRIKALPNSCQFHPWILPWAEILASILSIAVLLTQILMCTWPGIIITLRFNGFSTITTKYPFKTPITCLMLINSEHFTKDEKRVLCTFQNNNTSPLH